MQANQDNKKISEEGAAFLKAATAAPDFNSLEVEGIPDDFSGPTLVKKDYVYTTIDCPPGISTYLLITPTAGVAYYRTSVPLGFNFSNPQAFTSYVFPDAGSLFKGATTAAAIAVSNTNEVDRGRLITLCGELVCLNNAFNQYGSISCFKTPITRELAPMIGASDAKIRLNGVNAVGDPILNSDSYVVPVRDGAYSVSMNREQQFNFFDVLDDVTLGSIFESYCDSNVPAGKATFTGPCVLWDNSYDTIVFRVDVPSGVPSQSFVLKIWKAFEYVPVFNTLLYTIAHHSPLPSPSSLRLYREIERQLPIAVRAKDNPDFWNSVLSAVKSASSALSALPGPYGAVASGVHAVASALSPGSSGASSSGTAQRKSTRTKQVKSGSKVKTTKATNKKRK